MFYEILDLILINLRDKKSITWNFSVCNWEDLLFFNSHSRINLAANSKKNSQKQENRGGNGGRSKKTLFL